MVQRKRIAPTRKNNQIKSPFLFSWSLQPNILGDVYTNLRIFSILCSITIFILGITILVGWHYQNQIVTRIFLDLPAVKTNTAIGFIFGGIALFLSNNYRQNTFAKIVRVISACIVYLIGSLTLFEYIFSISLGIDELIYKEVHVLRPVMFPNRMAVNTALLMTLTGVSLLVLDRKIKGKYISQFLAICNFIILTPSLISYFYHIDFISGFGVISRIAVHSMVGFIILSLGIIFARPTQGFMNLVVSNSAGGYLARRLLVASIIGPFILSWVIYVGYKQGLYDVEFRFLLFSVSCMVLFTYLIWRTSQALHKIDVQKRQTESNLQFLTQAGKALGSSINFKQTLRTVAQLAISYIGDYCAIDIFDSTGIPKQIVFSGRDSKKEKIIGSLRNRHLQQMYEGDKFSQAIQTKSSVLLTSVTDDILQKTIRNKEDVKKLKQLKIISIMIVPIVFHDKVIGIMHFLNTDKENIYTTSIVTTAEELAVRAALAIENARLFADVNTALTIRDEFISIASHELKTPLTSLKVYAQILEKQLKKENDNVPVAYVQKMNAQIDRLTILIRDLLDVTKVQVGKLNLSLSSVDINSLLHEIVEDLQAITKTHKITIKGKVDHTIMGDRDRLGQVIINLLTNAIKYSPDANSIEVTIQQDKKIIKISFFDHGIGIDKSHLAKIFDRFYQVRDGKKTFAGLGMGLYIAKEIALRHGGDLIVESEKGKGSVFHLLLPIE